MDLTPGQKALLPFYGSIQSAVSQRVGTADLWSIVRAAAAAEGVTLTGVSATDMSGLRGLVAGQRNAGEALQRLGPSDAILAQHIGSDLSSRSLSDQALAPSWIVRFEHDVTINGQLVTQWRSSVFDGVLPATAGSLRSAVEADAQALADDYDVTHIGVGRMQIVAV